MLIPGIGAQQGDLTATMRAALSCGSGPVIVNASRGVIYAGSGPGFAHPIPAAALELPATLTLLVLPGRIQADRTKRHHNCQRQNSRFAERAHIQHACLPHHQECSRGNP
jgi:hypothetical protein